ncbi:hypothetical protein Bpla01_01500 [Burkholderia plantarii]|nr:hypothetical protein Bpla01_01500 [Burkholderia plantarii]
MLVCLDGDHAFGVVAGARVAQAGVGERAQRRAARERRDAVAGQREPRREMAADRADADDADPARRRRAAGGGKRRLPRGGLAHAWLRVLMCNALSPRGQLRGEFFWPGFLLAESRSWPPSGTILNR